MRFAPNIKMRQLKAADQRQVEKKTTSGMEATEDTASGMEATEEMCGREEVK